MRHNVAPSFASSVFFPNVMRRAQFRPDIFLTHALNLVELNAPLGQPIAREFIVDRVEPILHRRIRVSDRRRTVFLHVAHIHTACRESQKKDGCKKYFVHGEFIRISRFVMRTSFLTRSPKHAKRSTLSEINETPDTANRVGEVSPVKNVRRR